MSEPERPGQSEFIVTIQRLHAAQLAAGSPDEREAADHDLSHFLAMSAMGRLQEWFSQHREHRISGDTGD